MDGLKWRMFSFAEKIQVKKREVGYQDGPKPLTAIEDFCERFDRAVKNSLSVCVCNYFGEFSVGEKFECNLNVTVCTLF